MNWLSVLFAVAWVYVVTVLKRCKLDFWLFLVGSVGVFVLCLLWLEPLLVVPMQKAVAVVSGLLGELTGVFQSYFQKGMLFIQNGGNSLSLYIDFECSGIIETLAFLSLLWFFPVYRLYEKIIVSIAGILAIFFSNVMRIYLICLLIYFFGDGIYFYAHTVFGRIFFYACTIMLYFLVFTKSHIIRQKVGAFHYDGNR